jgi:hypothetical protein
VCRNFGLAKHNDDRVDLLEPACRAWSCPDCGPRRKREFELFVCAGEPTHQLDLTLRRPEGGNPLEAADKLLACWSILLKRMQRKLGKANIEYVWVMEGTEAGWPHLHIALRMPYLWIGWIKGNWHEITGDSYQAWIQRKDGPKAARYLSKYLSKDLHRFGNHKRYHHSRGWAPGFKQPKDVKPRVFGEPWWVKVHGLHEYLHRLVQQAHLVEQTTERSWIAWKLGHYPERAMAIPWVARLHGLPEPPQRASNTQAALQHARASL